MRNHGKIVPGNSAKPSKIRGLTALLGAAALIAATGCAKDTDDTGQDFETRKTGLLAFDTCEDLLSYFQGEALADLELGYGYGYAGDVALGMPEPPRAASDQASGAPGAANEAGGESGPSYSTTNVQEQGVDEADLVKTDGQFLYTVRNGHFLIYEAGSLALRGDVALTFNATQLLLSGDQVVVLGDSWEAPAGAEVAEAERYRSRAVAALYDVANRESPRLLRALYVDGYLVAARQTDRVARLVVHHQPQIDMPVAGNPVGAEPSPGRIDGTEGGTGASSSGEATPGAPAEPATPPEEVPVPEEPGEDEPHADDISADPEDPYQAWLAATRERIQATTVDEWIPQVLEVGPDGQVARRRAAGCEQFYRPGERSGLGTTVVLSLDLDRPSEVLPDPAVVTATSTVYASGENLYLATVNWRDFIGPAVMIDAGGAVSGGGASSPGVAVAEPPPEPSEAPAEPAMDSREQAQTAEDASEPDDREATQIHRLSLPVGGAASYRASGRVHGQPLNQWSFSEYEGHLRVAVTEHNFSAWGGGVRGGDVAVGAPTEAMGTGGTDGAPSAEAREQAQVEEAPRSVTRVTVLDAELNQVGQTEDLAPNEEIFAVRFLGERGFVVTFERKDPLFTIDLSTPTAPAVVGQLDVLGYSTYLHPVDDTHLLGIGRSADENGFETGMQLSLFDVSDFAAPSLAQNLLLGEGWSDALYDHHAVTFFEGTLLLPLSAWTDEGGLDGLEVYSVDVDEGIVRRGSIDHSAMAGQQGYAHVERSVVIDDLIYSVSNVGLVASDRLDLSEAARAVFPNAPAGGNEPGKGGEGEPTTDIDRGV